LYLIVTGEIIIDGKNQIGNEHWKNLEQRRDNIKPFFNFKKQTKSADILVQVSLNFYCQSSSIVKTTDGGGVLF